MTRAIFTVLGAIAGFVLGVVFVAIVNFSVNDPFDVFESGELLGYTSLIFGGVGAISGAVMGWAAHVWTRKPRAYVPVPRRPARVGDSPYKGPFGLR